jgi:hypothetical protein
LFRKRCGWKGKWITFVRGLKKDCFSFGISEGDKMVELIVEWWMLLVRGDKNTV